MDFSKICRTCLSKENLKPIFSKLIVENSFDTIFSATGVEIELNDGLPQNMCVECVKILKTILDFRKKCKDTEAKLLCTKNNFTSADTEIDTEECIEGNTKLHKNVDKTSSIELSNLEIENGDTTDDEPLIHLKEPVIFKEIKFTRNVIKHKSRITCKLCQKDLSIRSFSMHMLRDHMSADESRIECELCDGYILKDNLKKHMTLIHGSDFKCRFCKKEFKTKEILIEHVTNCKFKKKQKWLASSSREIIECDVCKKKMQKASLRLHKMIKHAGLGPVCEYCGKIFGNKSRLNEHYRAKHGYEKFKCKYCEFQCASVMAMKNHETRHRGEKPYVCESCGAKFHAAYLLAQHKQTHSTERRFKCELCPAAYKANNNLHRHKRLCHSNALYSCTICNRSYRDRHYAARHMRIVHRYNEPTITHK